MQNPILRQEKGKNFTFEIEPDRKPKTRLTMHNNSPRPVFGQPGWRRRMESRYGWDKEFLAIGVILLMFFVSAVLIRADDEAGSLPDPKEMGEPQPTPCLTDITFLPLPAWASAKMPPLPEQLKPMGHEPQLARPAPAAVAETKPDMPPMPKKLPQVYPLASSKEPAPAASDSPALSAVSPFLEWIKDHPEEAAAQARKEADASSAGSAAPIGSAPGATPYWMPPMIDTSAPAPAAQAGGNGSAAIYSTPQR
jgi:hypothetical protein